MRCRVEARASRRPLCVGPRGWTARDRSISWNRYVVLTACLGLLSAGMAGEGVAPARSPRPLIERILRDAGRSEAEKVRDLGVIQGKLSPADTAALASGLAALRGEVLRAAAEAMSRCGAGKEAMDETTAMVSAPDCPLDRWVPALAFVHANAHKVVRRTADDVLGDAAAKLASHLRADAPTEDLLAVLRPVSPLWLRGAWWLGQPGVVDPLARLLPHADPRVRSGAAAALSRTTRPEVIPGSAVLPLIRALEEADPGAVESLSGLLTHILAIEPDKPDRPSVVAWWKAWAAKRGEAFDLVGHALGRAEAPYELLLQEKRFIAWQVCHASRELPPARRAAAWRRLRAVFEDDASPARERAPAWLHAITRMAAREQDGALRREALDLLMKLSRDKDPVLRQWGFSLFGDLPGATQAGTPVRAYLDRVIANDKAPPLDRAFAVWSLRDSVKGDAALIERLITLGESFDELPDDAFKPGTKSHCIGQLCGVLSIGLGRSLSLKPTEWRAALKQPAQRDK